MRLLLTMLLLLSASAFAEKKPIYPPGAKPGGNFSPAILSDGTLYVSGQVGRDKDGNYPEKFEDEVKYTLEAIAETMKAAGFTLKDAVAVQVYLTDMELFARMNTVYTSMIPEPRPARTTVGVAKLVGKARIEITVTARK
jgi:enamine deaminase RidA (YjgF/YER057c/UK114 family)